MAAFCRNSYYIHTTSEPFPSADPNRTPPKRSSTCPPCHVRWEFWALNPDWRRSLLGYRTGHCHPWSGSNCGSIKARLPVIWTDADRLCISQCYGCQQTMSFPMEAHVSTSGLWNLSASRHLRKRMNRNPFCNTTRSPQSQECPMAVTMPNFHGKKIIPPYHPTMVTAHVLWHVALLSLYLLDVGKRDCGVSDYHQMYI